MPAFDDHLAGRCAARSVTPTDGLGPEQIADDVRLGEQAPHPLRRTRGAVDPAFHDTRAERYRERYSDTSTARSSDTGPGGLPPRS